MKDCKGNYRDIPGAWTQYAGYFPLWCLSYSIIPYIRMKFEQNVLGFQNLYNITQGVEVPWLTYQQFSNLIGNVTDMVVAEQEYNLLNSPDFPTLRLGGRKLVMKNELVE